MDTKDTRLTSNLHGHAKLCWGTEVISAAGDAKNANEVRTKICPGFLRDGSITAAFERKGKGKVSYSHRPHTRQETK